MSPVDAILCVAALAGVVLFVRFLGYRSRRDSYRLGALMAMGLVLAGGLSTLMHPAFAVALVAAVYLVTWLSLKHSGS